MGVHVNWDPELARTPEGYHQVPDSPGLGIRLNEAAMAEREKPLD